MKLQEFDREIWPEHFISLDNPGETIEESGLIVYLCKSDLQFGELTFGTRREKISNEDILYCYAIEEGLTMEEAEVRAYKNPPSIAVEDIASSASATYRFTVYN